MSLDKKIVKELASKMGNVSPRRVYQRLKEIEDEQIVTKEEAACILAYYHKISMKKFFDKSIIKNVREIIQKSNIQPIKVTTNKRVEIKESVFHIDTDGALKKIKEPFLPQTIIEDAKSMAKYYPLLYVFENSIRNFIQLVMTKKYSKDWWSIKISTNKHFKKVCQEVGSRKAADNENRFHGKRGSHEIFYTDIDDLSKIIEHYFNDFKPLMRKKKFWYDSMLSTMNLSRRIIAHNNPLTKRDFDRIKYNFADWCDQLTLAKENLGVVNG